MAQGFPPDGLKRPFCQELSSGGQDNRPFNECDPSQAVGSPRYSGRVVPAVCPPAWTREKYSRMGMFPDAGVSFS